MDRKERLKYLIEKNKVFIEHQNQKKNSLLQECLDSLQDAIIVEDKTNENDAIEMIINRFQINKYRHVTNSIEINIKDLQLDYKKNFFIFWDDLKTPILICTGDKIQTSLDDIFAVSFDAYIVAKDYSEIIHKDDMGRIWYLRN